MIVLCEMVTVKVYVNAHVPEIFSRTENKPQHTYKSL